MVRRSAIFAALAALSLGRGFAAAEDLSRRLFDFTPIAPGNPVVATIDSIQIPLSELRRYRDTEREHAITDPSSRAQKRALLEDLVSEYLWVDQAYRDGVPASDGFLHQMEATRTMILTDLMSARTAGDASRAPAEKHAAVSALADRLFEAEPIDISNEAYAIVKRDARAIESAGVASRLGPTVEPPQVAAAKIRAIIAHAPEAPAVRYEEKFITVRQILVLYAALPEPRPNLETHDGFLGLIKPWVEPELMAIEARKAGIAGEAAFQHQVIQNQNALLRFHMQGLVERRASDLADGPGAEPRLRAWYEAHKGAYVAPNNGGTPKQLSFEEARAGVAADYSVAMRDQLLQETARSLRGTHRVTLYEDALQAL